MSGEVKPAAELTAIDLLGAGLLVRFYSAGNRLHHTIFAVLDGNLIPFLKSVEGNEHSDWPPSPPMQHFHCETQERRGKVLMLVGMAGRSHWSACISSEQDVRWTHLMFEHACRFHSVPEWLGVTYRIANGISVDNAAETGISFAIDGHAANIGLGAMPIATSVATEPILTCSTDVRAGEVRIAACDTPHLTTAKSNRWRYSMQFVRAI